MLSKNQLETLEEQRRRTIRAEAEKRRIPYLVHFTHRDNLQEIQRYGLLGRQSLARQALNYRANDPERLDGQHNGICCSIGFCNYGMFYYARQRASDAKDLKNWVVLLIKPAVLWERDAHFYVCNAASNEAKAQRHNPTTAAAFAAMFQDFPGAPRANLNIPDHYPTHYQAEVIVSDAIPSTDIYGYVDSELNFHRFGEALPPTVSWDFPNFFGFRCDSYFWKKFNDKKY